MHGIRLVRKKSMEAMIKKYIIFKMILSIQFYKYETT